MSHTDSLTTWEAKITFDLLESMPVNTWTRVDIVILVVRTCQSPQSKDNRMGA